MRIFADLHHGGLAHSLYLTLEKRLGHELYFPIGEEWFMRGYWDIAKPYNNHPGTIKQYLDLNHYFINKDTHYELKDTAYNYTRKVLTWDQFMNTDIDVIIASIPDHYIGYRKLRDIYKPKAKVVCQMGNMFNEVYDLIGRDVVQNLMASTATIHNKCTHTIYYHQEIDQTVFQYRAPSYPITNVSSFVIGLPEKELFMKYKSSFSDWEWRPYASEYEPFVSGIENIAQKMVESGWGWHVKPRGDGFGHNWYGWGFIGRPIITNFSDYKDKLGGEIFQDSVTGIDLEKRSFEDTVKLIRDISNNPDQHRQMCEAIRGKVDSLINYEEEAKGIQQFLTSLV